MKTKCLILLTVVLIIASFSACTPSGSEPESRQSEKPAVSDAAPSSTEQEEPDDSSPIGAVVESALLNDEQYVFSDMYWLNNQEIMVCQYSKENSNEYRMVGYNIEDTSERVLFEWESQQAWGGVFQSEGGFRVYAMESMYELDANGLSVQETPFTAGDGCLSINGEYALRYSNGGTYIINYNTGSEQKVFDNTDEVIYNPLSWSHDGKYLALSKEEIQNINPPGTKPNLTMLPTEIVVIDKSGNDVVSVPVSTTGAGVEWIKGSYELVLQMQTDTESEDTLTVVDVDSGDNLCDGIQHGSDWVHHGIGIPNCVVLEDTISYNNIGLDIECDIYLYNYVTCEKKFFSKLPFYAYGIRFSADGQHVAMVAVLEHGQSIYLSTCA